MRIGLEPNIKAKGDEPEIYNLQISLMSVARQERLTLYAIAKIFRVTSSTIVRIYQNQFITKQPFTDMKIWPFN